MAPQTRNTNASHPPKNQKGTKASSGASSGISRKENAKKKLEKSIEALKILEKTYDKATPEKKLEIEDQRRLVEKQEKVVQEMPMDLDDDGTGEPRKNSKDVHQEGDEKTLFVDGDDHDVDQEQGGKKRPSVESDDHSNGDPRNSSTSPPKTEASPSTGDSGYESDDETGLVDRSDGLASGGELEQYFKGRFGHYYGVYQHGPQNAARHTIRFLADKNELPEELKNDHSKDADRNSRIPRSGKANGKIFRVLGLAWESEQEDGRMSLLDPKNWRTSNGGSCAVPMRVRVRWFSDDGPTSYEWRGAVKRQMYSAKAFYRAPNTIEYDGRVIVEKDYKIRKADYFLIDTAVRLEKRHREWKDGLRKRADRDPTPGLPLRSEQEEASDKREG